MSDFLATLADASYEGRSFPLLAADTKGGNDFARHVSYRRRGADVEYTGQRAYEGSLTIPLINTPQLVARYGDLASDVRADLLTLFETKPIGQLQHPTYGLLMAAITDWSEPIDAGARNGLTWTVQWVEHNGTASVLIGADGAIATDTTGTVTGLAGDADARSAGIAGYTKTAPVIAAHVAFLESGALAFTQINDAFRQMSAVVNGNLALPRMVGASVNGATRALLNLRSAVDALRGRYVVGSDRLRYYTVPAGMALWEVSQSVYGDSRRVRDLLRANTSTDPLSVPAGTVIVVTP